MKPIINSDTEETGWATEDVISLVSSRILLALEMVVLSSLRIIMNQTPPTMTTIEIETIERRIIICVESMKPV